MSTSFHKAVRCLPLAVVVAASVSSTAAAGPPAPTVPDKLNPPAGHKPFLVGHAVGVQIHACKPSGAGYAWSFVGPRADLRDDHGKVIVTHFGGPSWRAKDGSTVVGSRVDGATVDPTAIPWLLLSATPSPNPAAEGDRLSGTKYIQRISTTGGLPPAAAECNAQTAGTVAEVPYTSDYVFWKARG
jgi:hypothetical protein